MNNLVFGSIYSIYSQASSLMNSPLKDSRILIESWKPLILWGSGKKLPLVVNAKKSSDMVEAH